MRRTLLALCAAVFVTSGCYHVTVVTGAPEANNTIDLRWQKSFVYGLVPPPEVDTQGDCPNGVAKVETQQSFLNGLVRSITYGIFTPMQVNVTCASGPVRR